MISVVEMILSEKIITKEKPIYAYGAQHDIYLSKKDASKVYKIVKPEHADVKDQEYNWVEDFKKHPDLFPKVYREDSKGRWAELEKLDANKARKVYEELESVLKGLYKSFNLKDFLSDIVENEFDYKARLNGAGEYLQKNHPELASDFKKFVNLMVKLQSVNKKEATIDIHAGNFGFDKSGKLKMLDL